MTFREVLNLLHRGLFFAVTGSVMALAAPAIADPQPLTNLIASPVEGSWKTQNGTEVTIAPCDQGFCGTLSWVVIPPNFAGQCEQDKMAFGAQMTDVNNVDPALKTRPIVGMQMMSLRPTGDPRAFTAVVYNAEDGKTYDGLIWVMNNDTMLRLGGGCIGNICVVTQDWPRVPVRENTPDFTCRPN